MIFTNPAGAPELACDECGCRWFDRMTNRCYECGAAISEESIAEFQAALTRFDPRPPVDLQAVDPGASAPDSSSDRAVGPEPASGDLRRRRGKAHP